MMFCIKCGNESADTDLFCISCGEKLQKPELVVEPEPVVEPERNPYADLTQPSKSKSQINPWYSNPFVIIGIIGILLVGIWLFIPEPDQDPIQCYSYQVQIGDTCVDPRSEDGIIPKPCPLGQQLVNGVCQKL